MNTSQKPLFNYGISLLRMLLSFSVVINHFYEHKKRIKFNNILFCHIPTFFLISFYYTYKTLISNDLSKIKARLERLVIPYFSWCVISWIIFNINFYLFKEKCPHSILSFLQNLLSGRIYIVSLWFQNILILITLIIIIIIYIFKEKYILIFEFMILLSFYLQYSGINYYFFKYHFISIYYNTYGRIFEALPNALSGLFLSYFNFYNKIKKNRNNIIFLSLYILIFFTKYNFDNQLLSFRYGGIRKNISAVSIFLIFLLIPFDDIKNEKIKKILFLMSSYTAGIYFIHILIGRSKSLKILLGNSHL